MARKRRTGSDFFRYLTSAITDVTVYKLRKSHSHCIQNSERRLALETNLSKISSLNPSNVATIEKNGSQISPLDPIGVRVQGVAHDALSKEQQEYWSRLSSVNSASGAIHPLVHQHPISSRKCIWLHLGMTGAVIEKLPGADGFRLLNEAEIKQLCHQYNDILNAGLEHGYAINYEYQEKDCVFIDNLAVAHRASPEAHLHPEKQGLRIMHRSTVRGVQDLAPDFELPLYFDIRSPSPFGKGVWLGGGTGFRWDDGIAMQN